MFNENHIIHKVFLDIQVPDEKKARQINNNISSFLQAEVFPALEELFSKYSDERQIIRFDHLDLNVAISDWNDRKTIKSELIKKVEQKLIQNKEQKLIQNKEQKVNSELQRDISLSDHQSFRSDVSEASSSSDKIIPKEIEREGILHPDENFRETFLFFLENGYLPWFGKREYITEFTKEENWHKNLENFEFRIKLIEVIKQKQVTLKRFVLQFPNRVIVSFLTESENSKIINEERLLSFVNRFDSDTGNVFLMYLCKHAGAGSGKEKWQTGTVYNKEELHAETIFGKEEWLTLITKLFLILVRNKEGMPVDELYKSAKLYETELTEIFEKELLNGLLPKLNSEIEIIVNNTNSGSTKRIESNEPESKAQDRPDDSLQFLKLKKKEKQEKETVKDIVDFKIFDSAILENMPTIYNQEFVRTGLKKEPPFFESNKNNLLVQNAGLVLFHPFFKSFFNNFNWLNQDEQIKEEFLFYAVQAMHYCATGTEDFFEGNLLLEKFMCGIALETVVPAKSYLSTEVKNETEEMLRAVIGNWPALKNTTSNGLRQMFVHRDGKLIQKEKGFRLIVERKAQDILMDKLPWNISIVKLPWKDDLLFVEW